MGLCATWLLAVSSFGRGRIYSSFVQDEGCGGFIPIIARLMFWVCVLCCLRLGWLAVQLVAARTTYPLFERRLSVVMIGLFVSQVQFLLAFDSQSTILTLGALVNVFLAIAWFTPNAGEIWRWLPAAQSGEQDAADTLAIPLRRQLLVPALTYLILFPFFYWVAVIFFADVA